jgi:hypothetical protein
MAKQYYMLEGWGADRRIISMPFNSLTKAKEKMQHFQKSTILKTLDFYIIPYIIKTN